MKIIKHFLFIFVLASLTNIAFAKDVSFYTIHYDHFYIKIGETTIGEINPIDHFRLTTDMIVQNCPHTLHHCVLTLYARNDYHDFSKYSPIFNVNVDVDYGVRSIDYLIFSNYLYRIINPTEIQLDSQQDF